MSRKWAEADIYQLGFSKAAFVLTSKTLEQLTTLLLAKHDLEIVFFLTSNANK